MTERSEVFFIVSPSFHGVEEANAIRWAADLDQILPAHPQQIATCNNSRKSTLLPFWPEIFREFLFLSLQLSHSAKPASVPWMEMCCDFYLRSW